MLKNKLEQDVSATVTEENTAVSAKKDGTHGTQNSTHGINEDVLSEIEKQVLEMMKQNEKVTIEAMVEQIGVSKRTINRGIKALKEKGFITRKGSSFGKWIILK